MMQQEQNHTAVPPMLKRRLGITACALLLLVMAAALTLLNGYCAYYSVSLPLYVSIAFEVCIILFPALMVVSLAQSSVPHARMGAKRTILVIGMGVTGYLLTPFITLVWTIIWTAIGGAAPESATAMIDLVGNTPFWLLFVAIALTPAICEEFFFRGVLMKSLSYNPTAAVCISAALFALMHFDMSKLYATFALGLFIGWVVMRTGNLYAGVLLHLINNTASVVLLKLSWQLSQIPAFENPALMQEFLLRTPQLGIQTLLAGIALLVLVCLGPPLFILCVSLFIRDTRDEARALHRMALLQETPRAPFGKTLLAVTGIAMFAVALLTSGVFAL